MAKELTCYFLSDTIKKFIHNCTFLDIKGNKLDIEIGTPCGTTPILIPVTFKEKPIGCRIDIDIDERFFPPDFSIDTNIFGKKLKSLMAEECIDEVRLSHTLNCDIEQIYKYLNNECEPTASILKQLSIMFKVPTDYLIGLSDIKGNRI